MMRTGANNCMKRKHKPVENCYWVIPGQFLAGEYPGDIDEESSRVKINDLIRSGITAFIDLTEENEGLLPYSSVLCVRSWKRNQHECGKLKNDTRGCHLSWCLPILWRAYCRSRSGWFKREIARKTLCTRWWNLGPSATVCRNRRDYKEPKW